MRKIAKLAALGLCGAALLLLADVAAPHPTTVPNRAAVGPLLYGEWNPTWQTPDGGTDSSVITARETTLGHPLNLIHWYASGAVSGGVYVGEGYAAYDHLMVDAALALGRTPFVSWGLPIGFQRVAGNRRVLDDWAKGMAATHQTILVRLMWEFNDPSGGNGDFYVCHTNHTPGSLVTTWRYIVNRFRYDGATNVRFVWNPDGTMGTQMYGNECGSLKAAYPGDAYVDYRGFDTYDYDSQAEYDAENAQTASGRPMLLGEFGTTDATGGPAWVTDLGARIQRGQMGEVAGVVYFDDQQWAITPPSNPNTAAAVTTMLQYVGSQAR